MNPVVFYLARGSRIRPIDIGTKVVAVRRGDWIIPKAACDRSFKDNFKLSIVRPSDCSAQVHRPLAAVKPYLDRVAISIAAHSHESWVHHTDFVEPNATVVCSSINNDPISFEIHLENEFAYREHWLSLAGAGAPLREARPSSSQ